MAFFEQYQPVSVADVSLPHLALTKYVLSSVNILLLKYSSGLYINQNSRAE
jgi:hypothetical protein